MKRPWLGRKGALLPQRRQRVEDFLGHGRVSTSSAVGAQAPCDAMQCYAGRKSVWKIAAKWITFFLSQTCHFPLFRARRAPQAAYESAKFLSFWLRDDDLMHSVKLPPFNQTRRATLPTRTTDLWNLPKVAATAARQAALATPVTIPASEAEWYQTENARGWCCRADSQRSKPLLAGTDMRDSSWNRHARLTWPSSPDIRHRRGRHALRDRCDVPQIPKQIRQQQLIKRRLVSGWEKPSGVDI